MLSFSDVDAKDFYAVWALAIPNILTNISQPLLAMVDTAIIGRLGELEPLAAVSLSNVVIQTLFMICFFLRFTTTGTTAQARGTGISSAVSCAFWRALFLGQIVALLILSLYPFLHFIFSQFSVSSEVLSMTITYARLQILAAPAVLANRVIIGYLFGVKRAADTLWIALLTNLLNTAFGFYFVWMLKLGVRGAAFAYLISQYGGVLFAIAFYVRLPTHVTYAQIFERAALFKMLQVNGNFFIRSVCLIMSFAWFNYLSVSLGETVLAANSVLMNLQSLMASGLDGFANAAEILVGHSVGANDRSEFTKTLKVVSISAGGVACLFVLGYGLFGTNMVSAMTNVSDVVDTGDAYVWLLAVSPLISVWAFLLDGIYGGALQSWQVRNAMMFSFFSFITVSSITIYGFQGGNMWLWLTFLYLKFARTGSLMYYLPTLYDLFDQQKEPLIRKDS